jgi:DNA-binding CsgD family transcriptional regulator
VPYGAQVEQRAALRAQHAIARLCHAGLDSTRLRREVVEELRRVVPFDAWCFPTADPATLMITGNVGEGLPAEAAPRFFQIEYSLEDINKFADLARRADPVAGLSDTTGGDVSRSARWREVFHPLGLEDDLRAALSADGACWGYLALHRTGARGAFVPDELRLVSRVLAHLAEGLRTSLILDVAETDEIADGPGLVLLSDELDVVASTAAADRWLADLHTHEQPDIGPLPASVYAVTARLHALERSPTLDPQLTPRSRVRTAAGHWLVVHATRLTGANGPGRIAVIIEPAQPAEIAPVILQAYDLSVREREVTQQVIRGLSTSEIAERLFISSNTVQDHLKAIFEKVGVSSRRELVARIWTQQYWPRIAARTKLAADGSFATS